jgi:hypothetical protein
MDDNNAEIEFHETVLKLKAAVDGQENVEILLRDGHQRPISKGVPALFVNGGDDVIAEKQLDARVYALAASLTNPGGCAFEKLAVGNVKDGQHLLPRNWGIQADKIVDCFTPLEKVDQALDRDTCAPEARSAAHALRTYPNRLIQPALLIGG